MLFWHKLKECLISVLPIMALVYLLHWTIAPVDENIWKFTVGGGLLIAGLSVFLLGAEVGLIPIGQAAGAALTGKRNLPLMLAVGFAVGFLVTVAEPDVQVLASQAAGVDGSLSRWTLIAMIAGGVGLFVAVAMGRLILGFSLKALLAALYLLVFVCAYFTSPSFLGIAFDAGGATTGPLTVPFIMALGLGVASVHGGGNSDRESFGFIGLASVGPILAVLVLGMLSSGGAAPPPATALEEVEKLSLHGHFLQLAPEVCEEVAHALGPLVALFVLFQLWLLKMPPVRVLRMLSGLVYTYAGLVLFFVGVKGGFIPAGIELGSAMARLEANWLLVPAGVVLGALVVCAEPAVWVLNRQVETVSGGSIPAGLMLASLCIGVACSVGIAMFRVLSGLSIWWFLIPGYALAIGLFRFCPRMFSAIAFDSGGVDSGPMASTFILAFTLGASAGLGGDPIADAFGVIAMIAMTPLLTIQALGILFSGRPSGARQSRAPERGKPSGGTR